MKSTVWCLLVSGCFAIVQSSETSTKSLSARSILEDTVVRQRPDRTAKVQVEIALAHPSSDSSASELLRVSDPRSKEYGQHWTAQDVIRRFAPTSEHLTAVLAWLRNASAADQLSRSRAGGHIFAHLSISEAEELFGTTCFEYVLDSDDEDTWIDCAPYNLPEEVIVAIDYIAISRSANDVHVTQPRKDTKLRNKRSVLEEGIVSTVPDGSRRPGAAAMTASSPPPEFPCDRYTSPACLRALYNIPSPDSETAVHPNNSFGIYAQAYQTWLEDDLDRFFTLFSPTQAGSRPVVEPINGGYRQWDFNITAFNLEPNLDFQWAMTLTGPRQPVTNIQVGDRYLSGNLNTMFAAFDSYYCDAIDATFDPVYPDPRPGGYNGSDCGTVQPPKVLSISFAWAETQFSEAYLRRQCLEILKLGLMGVTVVVSSGDTGTQAGAPPGTCVEERRFQATWPAACPWITSVGGTDRTDSPDPAAPRERAWSLAASNGFTYTSSGGFSDVFPAPVYQSEALTKYQVLEREHLSKLNTTGHHTFNDTGRGIPDISVLAARYLVYLYGELRAVSGTSASAPVFASMIAMINNERLKAGKGTVGFVNPVLYANRGVFNDVAAGSNGGCGADPAYRAAEGWDPVTGLGTPDFQALKDVLVGLP